MSGDSPAGPGPRKEIDSTPREKPHVTENDRGAGFQKQTQAPDDVAGLPANAHGHDKHGTHDQPRDDASMYDGRPSEDKDQPASGKP